MLFRSSFSVAPDGRHLFVTTAAPRKDGRADKMPHYVSSDGYVKIEDVRSKVGTGTDSDEQILKRLHHAELELLAAHEFDVTIINDDLEIAMQQLERAMFE